MIKLVLLGVVFISGLIDKPIDATAKPREVLISTDDGVTIYADLFKQDIENPIILLFHQGGSNTRAEYTPIIPHLLDQGYNILAVDQRVGGQLYGEYNRTIAKMPSNNYGYCDVYLDLEASLTYALKQGFKGRIILWGSSYSASLAIRLGSENADDVSGVLAFSPASGGPMESCKPDPYFAQIKIPLLLLRPSSEMERESSRNQFNMAKNHGHDTYISSNGVHGSSMLVKERVNDSVEENWSKVLSFLSSL